jgi:hypothetical protein
MNSSGGAVEWLRALIGAVPHETLIDEARVEGPGSTGVVSCRILPMRRRRAARTDRKVACDSNEKSGPEGAALSACSVKRSRLTEMRKERNVSRRTT